MQNRNNIALLIDADNTSPSGLDNFMTNTGSHLSVKRAYGNWCKDTLKNWEIVLRRHGIRAVQQFDCAAGKNAADIALAVDAMDLLHSGLYSSFIIMASDSDYTPLVMRLRESGIRVAGVGKDTAPDAYKNACDDFYLLDSFSDAESPCSCGLIDDLFLQEEESSDDTPDLEDEPDFSPSPADKESIWNTLFGEGEESEAETEEIVWDSIEDLDAELKKAEAEDASEESIARDALGEPTDDDDIDWPPMVGPGKDGEIIWDTPDDFFPIETLQEDSADMRGVHKLLHIAYDYCKDEDGFAKLSSIGNFIKEIRPDFDYRDYGFKQLHELLLAYPERYQVITYPARAKAKVMAFRCCA